MKKLFSFIILLATAAFSAPDVSAQSDDVRKGKVVDVNGEAVIGASIVVKGTMNGTVTDIDGTFSISAPKGSFLVISNIGYKTVEMVVDNRGTYPVTLEEDVNFLDETVVIGYGTVKKKDLTGAVGSIAPSSFKAQPVQNVSEMIRGNAPGVTVKENGSGETKIRIRGANSLNGDNEPLYIVDGVPMGTYSPNDVESIEILKDASATAIYGSRGANGVIVVTTKRGKTGGPHVEVSANVSAATYPKYYDLLSGPEFKTFYKEYFGGNLSSNGDTDWQRSITRTGLRQNYAASVSGGSEKVKYHVGGNIINNTGLIKNSDDKTYRVRSNVDFKLGKRVSGKVDVSAEKSQKHGGATSGKDAMFYALTWNPSAPQFDANGNMTILDPDGISGDAPSPYYTTMMADNNAFVNNIAVNTYLDWEIIDGLKLSVQPSFCTTITENRNFNDKGVTISTANDSKAYRSTENVEVWNVTSLLNYTKTFGQDHNFSAMLGNELWGSKNSFYSATATGVAYSQLEWDKLEMAKIKEISSKYIGQQLASFFARVNYNYASKYYATITFRADGSSKFAPENKFSYFPSAALGWVLSNEDWLKSAKWLTFLKLRASYGVTGSQAIDSYSTLTTLSSDRHWAFGTTSIINGLRVNAPTNKDLKWESTEQFDVGVDFTVFDKLSFSFDYWNKTTYDLLTKRQYPAYSGGGESYINLGTMKNTGFDASITYTPFQKNDFYWTMTWNGSYLKNKVVDLGEMGEKFYPRGGDFTGVQLEDSPFIVQKGQPLGQFYGYNWLGIWSTDQAEEAAKYGEKPGDNRYEDVNGDGEINNDDKMVIGNYMPKFTWSYNTTINWKNFDFNLLLDGAHGMDMLNFNKMAAGVKIGASNTITLREAAENYWTPSRQNTMWAANSGSNKEYANSSKWVEKAGYVKIRNISIGYTLPASLLKGHELRFNISAQNLFTFTNYSGLDPEASVNDSKTNDIFGGVEYGVYPQARTFTAGITYKF